MFRFRWVIGKFFVEGVLFEVGAVFSIFFIDGRGLREFFYYFGVIVGWGVWVFCIVWLGISGSFVFRFGFLLLGG